MAENGKRQYQIVINGIKESIAEIDALLDSLKLLEKKITELENKKINISASPVQMTNDTNTNGREADTARVLDKLQAEDRVLKRIWQTERQIQETEEEQYQNLLKAKEVLKERQAIAKETAAEERLLAGEYANSMAGMKQELADIKRAMNFHDLDDVDWFEKQTKRANELNEKLKQIEQSYGQYGRNVGNYANGVAEGLKKAEQNSTMLKVTIGGVTREFQNAREASRTLGNELKSMAMAGKQNTKEYTELEKAFKRMQSTLKDIDKSSVAMDNMLDAAQSVTAMVSAGQGFATLFGIDNSELNESIQKLLALQTALNGLNTIMNQMKSGEFMGGIFDTIKNLFSSSKGESLGDGGASELEDKLESAADAGAELTKSMTDSKDAINGIGGATKAAGAGLKEMSEAGNAAAGGISNVTNNSIGAVASFKQLGSAMVQPQVEIAALNAQIQNYLTQIASIENANKMLFQRQVLLVDQIKNGTLTDSKSIQENKEQYWSLTKAIDRNLVIRQELQKEVDKLITEIEKIADSNKKEAASANDAAAATERNARAHANAVSSTDRAASSAERNAAATEKEAAAANAAATANEKLAVTTNQVSTANQKNTTTFGGFIGRIKDGAAAMFSLANIGKFLLNTLKMLGSMAIWGAIIWGVTELVSWISKWAKGNADLIKSEDLVKNQMEQVNQKLRERLELNKQLDTGQIGGKYVVQAADEKAYGEAIKETNRLLQEKIKLQEEDSKIEAKPITSSMMGDKGVTTIGGFTEGIKNIDDFIERYNMLNEAVQKGVSSWTAASGKIRDYGLSLSDAKDELAHMQQLIVGDFLSAMKYFDTSTRQGAMALDAFIKENDRLTNGIYSSALANMGNIVKDAGLKEALEQSKSQIQSFLAFIRSSNAQVEKDLQSLIKGGLDVANKDNADYWVKQIDEKYDKVIQAVKDSGRELTFEELKQLSEGREAEKAQVRKSINSRLTSERNKYKKIEKETLKLEYELSQLRVNAMREGLEKELAEIEANKKKELAKWKGNQEAIRLVNVIYDREILNAKKKWAKDIRDVYQGLADDIYKIMADVNNRNLNISQSTTERNADTAKDNSYASNIDLSNPDDINNYRKYSEEIVKIETDTNNKLYQLEQQRIQNQYDAAVREENIRHRNVLDLEAQQKTIEEINKRRKEDGSFIPQDDEKAWAEFENSMKTHLQNANGKLADAYNSGKITFKQFVTFTVQEQEAFNAKMDVLEKERKNDSENNVKETNDRNYQSYADYYDRVLDTVRNSQEDIDKALEKGEKESRNNAFQIINLSQYSKSLNEAKAKFVELRGQLVQEKNKLKADLEQNKIKPEEFTVKNKDLDKQIESIDNSLSEINAKSKDKIGEFVRDISQYVQAIGQGLQNLLSTVWDAQDAEYDKKMEELDKFISEYEDRLDKQKEITQQHANEIDSIEDALSTARGDRRQALIDKLNAEMAAQRDSLATEKKIEKEKKKLEAKKEKEALEQKKREKQRAVIQAIVSTALATVNGLATQPFMPVGIAMGALAAALGAVQIGIISSQKYAEGGLLQGKSHREGGIKAVVGRNPIELEGQEFVVRKKSAMPNIDVIDFINKSEKKLKLEDFIDFYTKDGKVGNNVRSMKNKFADGGTVIPTLRNDISIGDSLARAFESYAATPTVVQVVDIVNKAERLNQVQVMAGLED